MAYDPTTPAGQVRLLITDTHVDEEESDHQLLKDVEIEAFLAMEGGSVFRASALALETIAVDQVLVLKVIKTLDVQTDGAKVSDALLKRAKALRDRADDDASDEDDDFAIAEFADPVFGWRDRMERQFLRER